MLEMKHVTVETVDIKKPILKDFSLSIQEGEIHAIMGPNGAGKSTLSKVIFKNPNYEIKQGEITLFDQDLKALQTEQIARMGAFLVLQDPPVIEGVSTSDFMREALYEKTKERVNLYSFVKEIEKDCQKLSLKEELLHQSINQGLSGGERKKNELLQLLLLKPKLIVLDELDSGLDVDSLKQVCKVFNDYLKEYPSTSVLIITHYSRILEYIHPDFVHKMVDGKIVQTGTIHLAKEIEKEGYQINEHTKEQSHE